MAHDRVYSPDDPTLEKLRKVALAFPEAVEVEAWGRPTFRAGKKIFVTYHAGPDHPSAIIIKPDPEDEAALRADSRFFVPKYWTTWLAVDLDASDIEWDEVAELLESSYRQVALKRMLTRLDESPERS
ncbi:MAG: MmcQ/YjbR family DNA-binding protein [Actinomycetia bacterium]|nr:MmcQ/YjbR family DNA-binding protein [Actinomycetes bacterium]